MEFKFPEKKPITLRLDKDILEQLDKLAEHHGVDRSAIIRVFINEGLTNAGAVEEDK